MTSPPLLRPGQVLAGPLFNRRDCYWLYVVTHCDHEPLLEVDALTHPMRLREGEPEP